MARASGPKSPTAQPKHRAPENPAGICWRHHRRLDLDVVVEMYATRTGRMVSHKIIRNYLSELSTKIWRHTTRMLGHQLWCSTGSAHISNEVPAAHWDGLR